MCSGWHHVAGQFYALQSRGRDLRRSDVEAQLSWLAFSPGQGDGKSTDRVKDELENGVTNTR